MEILGKTFSINSEDEETKLQKLSGNDIGFLSNGKEPSPILRVRFQKLAVFKRYLLVQ